MGRVSIALRVGLLVCGGALLSGSVEATPITYTFSGSGAGRLGGTGGNNASSGVLFVPDTGGTTFTGFTVTVVADTTTVAGSLATGFSNDAMTTTFSSGALTATFSLPSRVVENTLVTPGIIIFGENQPSPVFFVAEGLSSSAFNAYDLATPLALTTGSVSFLPQIFSTSAGDLEFDAISTLSLQAVVAAPTAVPEPASATLVGLGVLGLAGYRRLVRRQ